MNPLIRNEEFIDVKKNVKPDTRRRIALPAFLVPEGVSFHVYANSEGQIILNPQVSVPAAEAWIYQDEDVLASVRRGLAEAAEGKTTRVGPEEL